MKQLKSLLPEYWDSHEKQFNVLIVTDDASLERTGFFRHIISKRLMNGEIVSIDKGTSADIRNKVVAEANPELDLIIVFSRGIYDEKPMDIIRNLNAIQQYADTIDTPIVIFSIPTIRFIKDKKNIPEAWSEQLRKKLNNVLINNFGAIDISHTDRDEYFKSDGKTLSMLGHIELYRLLRDKVKIYNVNMPSIAKDNEDFKLMLNKVQIKLLDLGYNIKQSEISNKIYGTTTKRSVRDIIKLLGYPPTEQLTTSIAKAILLLDKITDTKIVKDVDADISIVPCDNPKFPGARERYHPSRYTGTNGIESAQSLRTVRGTKLKMSAAEWYDKMIGEMNAAGIKDEGPAGGFRTYQTQYNIVDWDLYECNGIWRKIGSNGNIYIAEPGKSNHGTGKAIDVRGKAAQNWIRENGMKYGWAWYSKDGGEGESIREPWHFTYVGGGTGTNTDDTEEEKGMIDKGFDFIKQTIPGAETVLSIFDHKNPVHVNILREEIQRAKRLIREYDESKIWKEMPEKLRMAALLSFDDDKGPDAADEYAEQDDWKRIPDLITNGIDLSKFDTSRVDATAFAEWLTQNKSKLPSGTWFVPGYGMNRDTDQLIEYLKNANPWPAMVATRDAIGILMYDGYQIPLKDLEAQPSTFTPSADFAPGVDPLRAIRRPGSNWTGD